MAEKYVSLRMVKRKIDYVLRYHGSGLMNCAIKEALERVPTEDVAPIVYGEWVYSEYDIPHCSECGHEPKCISPYCPNCGANMEVECDDTE